MFLHVDMVGAVDPAKVMHGVRRAMEAHPVTAGNPWFSLSRAWPYWCSDAVPSTLPYRYYDLSSREDWLSVADKVSRDRAHEAAAKNERIRVCLEHFQGPNNHHRIYCLFQHALMDVEGAQLFMAEVNRLADEGPSERPAHLLPDEEPVDPLGEAGMIARLRKTLQGTANRVRGSTLQRAFLLDTLRDRPRTSRRLEHMDRHWTPDQVEMAKKKALKTVQPGPALFSRFLAVVVLRAVHRIHKERGRRIPYYGMMFPMRYPGIERRPLWGNYLVSAAMCIPVEHMDDPRAVGRDVDQQLGEYMSKGSYGASWSIMWLTSQLRHWQYCMLMNVMGRAQPYITGYSFWGPLDPPLRRFVGADVTNLFGYGLISIPPGWNPVFSKVGNRINLSMAYPGGSFPEEVVRRYADLIEDEATG